MMRRVILILGFLLLIGCHQRNNASRNLSETTSHGLMKHDGREIFLNGLNLGWVYFGNDVGCIPANYGRSWEERKQRFETVFKEVAQNKGNLVRVWLHVNGELSPNFSSGDNPVVTGLDECFIDSLKEIMHLAEQYELLLDLSLWSHDLLMANSSHPDHLSARAVHMLDDEEATKAYIKNALIPMVKAVLDDEKQRSRRTIFSWEILNEPEGISREIRLYYGYQYDWIDGNPSHSEEQKKYLQQRRAQGNPVPTLAVRAEHWQRFIAQCAAAIHAVDPQAKVTTGAHSMNYLTDVEVVPYTKGNYYADDKLIKQGFGGEREKLGKFLADLGLKMDEPALSTATLDYYQVHYYEENDALPGGAHLAGASVYDNPASHWRLGKPLVIGEYYGTESSVDKIRYLLDNGYAGAWGWSYNETRKLEGSGKTQWDFVREITKGFSCTNLSFVNENEEGCR